MSGAPPKPACLDDLLNGKLEWIDGLLAKAGREVGHRPLEAGMFFVKHFVQAVKFGGEEQTVNGGQPGEWFREPWFTKLMEAVNTWYRRKYGAAIQFRGPQHFRSIAVLHDTPFELRIPKTLNRPGKPGETVWLVLPVDVQPEERVLGFLVKPPNMEAMSGRERFRAEHAVSRIARAVRQVNCNLRTAVRKYPELDELIRGIERHLERAVADLLDGGQNGVGSALYELYMSVEKALKVVLVQKHRTVKRSHDLSALVRRVNKAHPNLHAALPNGMPTWRDVNAYRYGAAPPTSAIEAIRLYYRVLALIQPVTAALRRRYITKNAALEIALLPWV